MASIHKTIGIKIENVIVSFVKINSTTQHTHTHTSLSIFPTYRTLCFTKINFFDVLMKLLSSNQTNKNVICVS